MAQKTIYLPFWGEDANGKLCWLYIELKGKVATAPEGAPTISSRSAGSAPPVRLQGASHGE